MTALEWLSPVTHWLFMTTIKASIWPYHYHPVRTHFTRLSIASCSRNPGNKKYPEKETNHDLSI